MWKRASRCKACGRALRQRPPPGQGEHAQSHRPTPTSLPGSARWRAYDDYHVQRRVAARDVKGPLPKVIDDERDHVQTRMLSLLAGQGRCQDAGLAPGHRQGTAPVRGGGHSAAAGLPCGGNRIAKLGASLLDGRHGEGRTMYVRTSALVTNLGVHFKLGRENAAVWVTSLDKGKPVAGAKVRVSDCRGRELAQAITNEQGVAHDRGAVARCAVLPQQRRLRARVRRPISSAPVMRRAGEDMAFTWSDWQRGIEPWRFNVPTSSVPARCTAAHRVRPHPAARGRNGVDEALLPPGKPQGP